ncbi:MAG: TRAP transporter substrate-binding protein [Rhodospirillaceae bacterium]
MPASILRDPIQIRLGGYGPPTTAFSKSLQFIGERLEAQFGDAIEIHYVWNIMDLGYRGEDIIWLVESGLLTLGYQSSSYLTDRARALGFVDLPFQFRNNAHARDAMDGELGRHLTDELEANFDFRILGWFENGFRHISNRLRSVRRPEDMAGMKIRVLPSDEQAKTFALLGAEPMKMDLTEAIAGVVDGSLDAQENPFANTVTYGVHNHHPYHTATGHFYISRPIFAHRPSVDAWPDELRAAAYAAVTEAVAFQRGLAEQEAVDSRRAIIEAGGEVIDLTADEHAAFAAAVGPQLDEARGVYGAEMFRMLDAARPSG